jgi:hypothetical protein
MLASATEADGPDTEVAGAVVVAGRGTVAKSLGIGPWMAEAGTCTSGVVNDIDTKLSVACMAGT